MGVCDFFKKFFKSDNLENSEEDFVKEDSIKLKENIESEENFKIKFEKEINMLNEIVIEKDGVRYIQKGDLGNIVLYPKDYKGKVVLKIDDKEVVVDLSKDEVVDFVEEDLGLHLLGDGYKLVTTINFEDITDYEVNNFKSINKSTIESQGLWAGYGVRKLKLILDEELEDLLTNAKDKLEVNLKLLYKNNEKIDNLEFEADIDGESLVINLDTDKFVEFFENNENEFLFSGELEFVFNRRDISGRDDKVEYILSYPITIKIVNPNSVLDTTQSISIDFGTSSTCVAKNRGKDLIAFTDSPQGIEDYENKTILILMQWEKIYNQWKRENKTIPYIKRKKENVSYDDAGKEDYFDYSNPVIEELKEAPSAKVIDAIVSEFKLLPKKLKKDKINKPSFRPFDNWKNVVFLTDDIGEEDEETINPIAFYAYFIGRSVNLQINNKIYGRYEVTIPVSFNDEEREIIRKSIEYGIKRAIPSMVRDKVEIKLGKEESVALLGAAQQIKVISSKEPQMFAVFDFGGGTIDFSYGVFRKADRNNPIMEEEKRFREVVELFHTDGLVKGGEVLIERLAYRIYTWNKDIMKEHRISIAVPEGEEWIKNFDSHLKGTRHIDYLNLNSIKEKLARKFFIENEFEEGVRVELFSVDNLNADKGEEIELEHLNRDEAEEFLRSEIEEAVKYFKNVLERVFKENEERLKELGIKSLDDVVIIKAGNASKSKYVDEAFKELFENKEIKVLEDKDRDITVKNCVAKGALILRNVGVYNWKVTNNEGRLPLDRYIFDIEKLRDSEEAVVLRKGDTQKVDFKFAGLRDFDVIEIFYSDVEDIEDDLDDRLKFKTIKLPEDIVEKAENEGKFDFLIRPYDGEIVEVVISDGEDYDESDIFKIDLEKAEVIKES